jgi:hypothetical protein
MYSDTDIESAVAAGILTPETATAFRDHVAAKRGIAPADEERFRLLGGFNDVFLTLAILLVLVFPISFGEGFIVAGVAWGLAEFVTRQRRLALPSIVLLLTFAIAVYLESASLLAEVGSPRSDEGGRFGWSAAGAAVACAATLAYWWRFRVPMAQAVLAASGLATIILAILAAFPDADGLTWTLLGAGGFAIFAYAMWWDLADRERRTHRADIAFWLHLLAAPLIAHSVFGEVGVFQSDDPLVAPVALAIYVLFSVVAIIVDRRAILVSSLGYALAAMTGLFGDVGKGFLLASLLLGGTLLMLGLFWSQVRGSVVIYLPEAWQDRLPPIGRGPV